MKKSYQPGDILIFKAEDDFLSRSIAWLTNSDVSHSAMFYTKDSIVETIAPGVVQNQVRTGKGDFAYLLRLTPAKDSAPLIQAAKKYMDAGTQYNFPALLYLGGLLLCRRITPTTRLLSITERIMDAACLELDKLLQRLAKHPGNRSMVCSQFVYQVYEDCGEDYRIHIHGALQNGFKQENMLQETHTIRLLDLQEHAAISLADTRESDLDAVSDGECVIRDVEEEDNLIAQLYQALSSADIENSIAMDTIERDGSFGMVPIVNKFAGKLKKLTQVLGMDAPIDSLFVAPADFVYHAENLENLGGIQIERIR